MFLQTTDLTRLVFQALAGLVLIAGATADLYLCALWQTRRAVPSLRACAELARRPFAAFHVQLVVFATLLFALPALLQPASAAPPHDLTLIFGPLLYACTGFLAVALCLTYSGSSLRSAFFSPGCSVGQALKKGLFYGLAAIPPVALLSMAAATVTESLGYAPQLQEVFDWLGDDALAPGTRAFMIAAAVVVAPVVEEFLFRGILLTAVLKGRPFFFSALLSGAYFALVHFHAPSYLPLLALSIAFSAGYAATGSILTPIVMHALFNFTSVLFYFADPL